VPHINQLFNAVHIQAHFIPIDCPQQQHQLADEQMRVSLLLSSQGGPCEVTKQNNNNTTGLLAGYLGTADGWEARCGRFLGEGREFLADMRAVVLASCVALSISWKDEPWHRDAALSVARGSLRHGAALMTPQSFQKCIDDKISSHSAPVAREDYVWTCARSRVRRRRTGHQKTTASRSGRRVLQPRRPRAVGEAGSQCACRNA
jgi:hypothetical protein